MFYFPFFLKSQQFSLKDRLKLIPYKHPALKVKLGLHAALEEDKNAYDAYAMSIKSWFGFFKSFMPGTGQYNTRIRCANAIVNSNEKIDQLLNYAKTLIR